LADQKIDKLPWHTRLLLGRILKSADQISATSASQEAVASRFKQTVSNRMGDVFANQIRFVYNAILKERKSI